MRPFQALATIGDDPVRDAFRHRLDYDLELAVIK